jgi:hypothetical protein
MLLVAAGFAACGAFNPGDSHTQGIEGRYVITGPGVIRDCGELEPGAERDDCEKSNQPWTRPVAATEVEVRDSEDRLLTTVVTDNEGAFRVELSPGDYLLCDAGCDGPITVVAGAFAVYQITLAVP